MRTALFASPAIAAIMSTAASAAPTLDAKGKCRDNGKFVAASMCKAPAAAAATGAYKADAKGKCRDAKGKFVKADMCKAK